jgi:hypothetical protein
MTKYSGIDFIPPPHLVGQIKHMYPYVMYNTMGVVTNLYVIGGYIEAISRVIGYAPLNFWIVKIYTISN